MRQSRTVQAPKVDQLQEVAVYLRQADRLVKKGHYSEALEEIQKARSCNPKNLYALAYEERVRSILTAKNNNGSSHSEPSGDDLEKISNRAIAEAQRSADAAAKQQERISRVKNEEGEIRQIEEQQRAAIRKKVYDLLLKAREYRAHGEYNRALDEVARIHMIDPSNENATELETQIRADQDKAIRDAEAERQRRQQEEERRRKEHLKAELERIKKEDEVRKRQEEEARRNAQIEKVKQHLKRAREFCDGGYIEDALAELAFVVVIDPLNEEVIELEQQIRELEEEQQAAEIEKLEQEKKEKAKAREELQAKVQKHIENAQAYLRQNKFTEAIRVISSAYIIDPLNTELQKCEDDIFKARDKYIEEEEEKRRRHEEQQRESQEEEMRQLIKAAQERAKSGEGAQREAKIHETKQKIADYVKKARGYLKNEQFENALGEIALAFVLDPFDENIAALEQEIVDAQNKRRAQVDTKQSDPEPRKDHDEPVAGRDDTPEPVEEKNTKQKDDENQRSVQATRHIAEARRLRKLKEYHKARNELTKAFMLDPLNDEIKVFEEQLQEEYAAQQEEAKRVKATRAYANRAKQYLMHENFAKAVEEVDNGLKTNPDDEELSTLKKKIKEAEERWKEVETLWERVSDSDRDARSGRANTKNQYKEALANYYAKLDEAGVQTKNDAEIKLTAGSNGTNGSGKNKGPASKPVRKKTKSEPEVIDLEEEIRKVYTSWREEQEQVERGEREAAIQKHIKQAKKLLRDEFYDDALAEIAYAKLIEENRKDLNKLESEIWHTWNNSAKVEATGDPVLKSPDGASEDLLGSEQKISLQIHMRAAEEFIENKDYAKALDEVTKAYLIDPMNDAAAKLEERIRSLQGKNMGLKQLKMIYPPAKAVGGI